MEQGILVQGVSLEGLTRTKDEGIREGCGGPTIIVTGEMGTRDATLSSEIERLLEGRLAWRRTGEEEKMCS